MENQPKVITFGALGKYDNLRPQVKPVKATYEEMTEMRDQGKLIPGQYYQITDYVTTTAQAETQSAGHPFDILVRADNATVLSEDAWAVQHEGDTYFANARMEAWRLKYALDNNYDRFAWCQRESIVISNQEYLRSEADDVSGANYPYCWKHNTTKLYTNTLTPTAGTDVAKSNTGGTGTNYQIQTVNTIDGTQRGVIYWMQDEFGNKCAYDFKNIMFASYKITAMAKVPDIVGQYGGYKVGTTMYPSGATIENEAVFRYTFDYMSGNVSHDATIYQATQSATNCHDNIIGSYYVGKQLTLNNIVIGGTTFGACYGNEFGENCRHFRMGHTCYGNRFGVNNYQNTWGNSNSFNTWGNINQGNTWGNSNSFNTWGNSNSYNTWGDNNQDNTWGNSNSFNTWGNINQGNTWGNSNSSNTWGNSNSSNTWGNNNHQGNTWGNSNRFNTWGNSNSFNTWGNSNSSNTWGDINQGNTWGNSNSSNTWGKDCRHNTWGNINQGNTWGNSNNSNTWGNSNYSNTWGNSNSYNTWGDINQGNTWGNSNSSNTWGKDCRHNTWGDINQGNTWGNSNYSNTWGNSNSSNTWGNINQGNTWGNSNTYMEFSNPNGITGLAGLGLSIVEVYLPTEEDPELGEFDHRVYAIINEGPARTLNVSLVEGETSLYNGTLQLAAGETKLFTSYEEDAYFSEADSHVRFTENGNTVTCNWYYQ